MQKSLPSGFQVLSSPGYQVVVLNEVSKTELINICKRLDQYVKTFGYGVENWGVNPIFIVNPGGWVLPVDQRQIEDWILGQAECKYLRTVREKNQRLDTMRLEFLNEARGVIDFSEMQIA